MSLERTEDLEAGLSMSLSMALICMGREFREMVGARTLERHMPSPEVGVLLREGNERLPLRAWAVVEFDTGEALEVPLDIWPFGAERGRARG